jgi:hypothetical protein
MKNSEQAQSIQRELKHKWRSFNKKIVQNLLIMIEIVRDGPKSDG